MGNRVPQIKVPCWQFDTRTHQLNSDIKTEVKLGFSHRELKVGQQRTTVLMTLFVDWREKERVRGRKKRRHVDIRVRV